MDSTRQYNLIEQIAQRRERLGMSFSSLAERSGVSMPTLKRMLTHPRPRNTEPRKSSAGGNRLGEVTPARAGVGDKTSLRKVHAVAAALGMTISAKTELSADELCEQQAEAKARELVALVHGTSALEAQGLNTKTLDRMIERAKHQLLNGPRRKLWASHDGCLMRKTLTSTSP